MATLNNRLRYIFVAVCILTCSNGFSQCDSQDEISRLYRFYEAYISEGGKSRSSKSAMDSILVEYCTKSLLRQMRTEWENGMDWDPFVKAQDFDLTWLESLQIKKGNEFRSYRISFLDKPSGKWFRIEAEVLCENGIIRICTIRN